VSFAKMSVALNMACIASPSFQLRLLNRIRSSAPLRSFSIVAACELPFSQWEARDLSRRGRPALRPPACIYKGRARGLTRVRQPDHIDDAALSFAKMSAAPNMACIASPCTSPKVRPTELEADSSIQEKLHSVCSTVPSQV
jgi:hypothetical protein